MQDVIEFEHRGAKISIPTANVLNNWLETVQLRSAPKAASKLILPHVGQFCADAGGIYAGILSGDAGSPGYHLFHATAEHEIEGVTWDDARKKASKAIAGFFDWSLPDRREARLLAINTPDGFDKDGWYWTSAQYASYSDYAWIQDFSDGDQDDCRKSNESRARAVRRVLIIE